MKISYTRILKSLLAIMLLAIFSGCGENSVSTDLLLSSAVECAGSGKWQACDDNALTVLKRDPSNTCALLLRSIALEHMGKAETALAMAKQAAENAPDDFPAQYNYGRLLAARGDSAKNAIQVLERALKLRPGNRSTLILLGQCSSKINADNAINYYLALPPAVQKMPEIQTRIAIYYLDRRDRQAQNLTLAYNALRSAYKSAPHNPAIVLNLALFLDHYAHNRNVASKLYRNYLTLTEHNPELNMTRAMVNERMSKLR